MSNRAIGEHYSLFNYVIDRLAIYQGARAAGIICHHAADGGATGGGDVGRKTEAVNSKSGFQLIQNNARFDSSPALSWIDFDDSVQIFRRIHHNAGPYGLTGWESTATTSRYRHVESAASLN